MGDTQKGCIGCLVVIFLALLAWALVIGGIITIIYAVKA